MNNIQKAQQSGPIGKLAIYTKMSGPGWIQAAVTLGGGSLVSALYLGVIGGFEFLWLQPLAMLCGIIMLAAISYVTLSVEERPFRLMKKRVSPTLAWGWLIATVVADTVFCAAQFALGRGALEDNLGVDLNPYIITGSLFVVAMALISISQKNAKASAIIDNILKVLVAVIVLAFMGVVGTLAANGAIPWGELFRGLIPDFTALFSPTDKIAAVIERTGESSEYWTNYVTGEQRNKIIAAFGAAVGINMTFLLPYSLRKKGWDKKHRELSRFDLVLGLFVPFILGASALVIASAASFHAKYEDVLSEQGVPKSGMEKIYYNVVDKRLGKNHQDQVKKDNELRSKFEKLQDGQWVVTKKYADQINIAYNSIGKEVQANRDALPLEERQLAAMLANRKAKNLADSLKPFLGDYSQKVFGIGILAMAISTLLVHMMMNGYAISEAFNKLGNAKYFIIGAAFPAIAGFFSPFLWSGDAKAAMQIPASVIATTLLPIAYLGFILLMNSKAALGDQLPKNRLFINSLMLLAMGAASFASIWALTYKTGGVYGIIALAVLAVMGIAGFSKRNKA